MTTRDIHVFHSFGNFLPAFCRIPRTFTIHDFRLLDNPSKPGGGGRLRLNIKRSDGIICLTEHGKERLLFHAPDYDPKRISIIPHGVDRSRFYPYDPSTTQQTAAKYGITFPYVIQLGSWFPHKNLELSIRAFARTQAYKKGTKLVFVGGGATSDYRSKLDNLAKSENIKDDLIWVDHVSADHLPPLLSGAQCMLQPSRYEGFALPILEAMAAGVPGVVSDSSCLPEVSGGLWPISGQNDAASFADGIDDMVLNKEKQSKVIQAGLERAAQFTWESAAAKTTVFLRNIHSLGKRTERQRS